MRKQEIHNLKLFVLTKRRADLLTFDEALKKHYEMWEAMGNQENPPFGTKDRADFKRNWINSHEKNGKIIKNNCYLCEYARQISSEKCKFCPIIWSRVTTEFYPCESIFGAKWYSASIPKILALPVREKTEFDIVE